MKATTLGSILGVSLVLLVLFVSIKSEDPVISQFMSGLAIIIAVATKYNQLNTNRKRPI
jgi:hypothetical protein